MLELLAALSFIGYLVYLRYYADQRTDAQKEADRLREGIELYDQGQLDEAEVYFNRELAAHPKSSVAYLYHARVKRVRGNLIGARADVEQGKSYDSSIADLHLESGQIYYEQGDYPAAFRDFDKAVFTSFGQEAEPYRWRGLVRQQLREDGLAQQDFARAKEATAQRAAALVQPAPAPPFFDRKFFLHVILAGLGGVLVLLVARQGYGIHVPYLAAVLSGISLGWLQPRKGWLLALVQVAVLLAGYVFLMDQFVRQDLAAFSVFGSVGLILVGGLLGGVLKRNL